MKTALYCAAMLLLAVPVVQAQPSRPPRRPAVQAATVDWLRQRLGVREVGRNNRGPEVDALVRAGGGDPHDAPEWCGFTQTADQRAHGLPFPSQGMQGAARAWFYASNPRTHYLAGRRGAAEDLQPGDLVGVAYGGTVHHIMRVAEIVPPLRKGRPPRGFYTIAGNEGRFPGGMHHSFYAAPSIAAGARWDYP